MYKTLRIEFRRAPATWIVMSFLFGLTSCLFTNVLIAFSGGSKWVLTVDIALMAVIVGPSMIMSYLNRPRRAW